MTKFRFLASFLLTAVFSLLLGAAEVLPLLSPAQKAYLALPRDQRIAFFGDAAKRKELAGNWHPQKVELAVPEQGDFVLTESGNPTEKSKRLSFGGLSVTIPAYVLAEKKDGKLAVGNLKIATAYQWKSTDKSGALTTEDAAPRLLKVENVPNVRDLGGRMTSFGVRVKQGRIYRTAGMNDNAKPVFVPDDALRAKNPALAHQLDVLNALKKQYRAEGKEKASAARRLPYGMDGKWVVFRPERKLAESDLMQLEELKAVPATLFGAKPETVSADKNFSFRFSGAKPGYAAVFVREFRAKKDGFMQVKLHADSYCRLYCNGSQLFSSLASRMGRAGYVIDLPVRKGSNLLVVPVVSGSREWGLRLGPLSKPCSRDKAAKALYEKTKSELRWQAISGGSFTPGKNRFTPEGLRYFTEDLGVRSDLDLRHDIECAGMTGSPAGPTVHWFHVSSSSYDGLDSSAGRKAFAKDFKIFLDEKNYPIVFHCIGGQDRTGSLAFLLNGLLGVPEEQLFQDWESTIFWNPDLSFGWSRIAKLAKMLDSYPGNNVNEKIEAFVLARGFTRADVAKFRKLMLEEPK